MAAPKRYSVERIIAKLREAEKPQGQGLTIPQAYSAFRYPITPPTVGASSTSS